LDFFFPYSAFFLLDAAFGGSGASKKPPISLLFQSKFFFADIYGCSPGNCPPELIDPFGLCCPPPVPKRSFLLTSLFISFSDVVSPPRILRTLEICNRKEGHENDQRSLFLHGDTLKDISIPFCFLRRFPPVSILLHLFFTRTSL